jgi:hypothetical protein
MDKTAWFTLPKIGGSYFPNYSISRISTAKLTNIDFAVISRWTIKDVANASVPAHPALWQVPPLNRMANTPSRSHNKTIVSGKGVCNSITENAVKTEVK